MWDSLNTQAWLGIEPKKKGGLNYTLTKRFKTNREAKSYAFKLAKKYKAPIYDKYYGTYIGRYSKAKVEPKAKSLNLGFGKMFSSKKKSKPTSLGKMFGFKKSTKAKKKSKMFPFF